MASGGHDGRPPYRKSPRRGGEKKSPKDSPRKGKGKVAECDRVIEMNAEEVAQYEAKQRVEAAKVRAEVAYQADLKLQESQAASTRETAEKFAVNSPQRSRVKSPQRYDESMDVIESADDFAQPVRSPRKRSDDDKIKDESDKNKKSQSSKRNTGKLSKIFRRSKSKDQSPKKNLPSPQKTASPVEHTGLKMYDRSKEGDPSEEIDSIGACSLLDLSSGKQSWNEIDESEGKAQTRSPNQIKEAISKIFKRSGSTDPSPKKSVRSKSSSPDKKSRSKTPKELQVKTSPDSEEKSPRKFDGTESVDVTSLGAYARTVISPEKHSGDESVDDEGTRQVQSPKQSTSAFSKIFKRGSSKDPSPKKRSPHKAASPRKKSEGKTPKKSEGNTSKMFGVKSPGGTGDETAEEIPLLDACNQSFVSTGTLPTNEKDDEGKIRSRSPKKGTGTLKKMFKRSGSRDSSQKKPSPQKSRSPWKKDCHKTKTSATSPGRGVQASSVADTSASILLSPQDALLGLAVSSAASATAPIVTRRRHPAEASPRSPIMEKEVIRVSVIVEEDELCVSSKVNVTDDGQPKAEPTSPNGMSPPELEPARPYNHQAPVCRGDIGEQPAPSIATTEDLSTFDMPLISSNIPENMAETNDYARPRSSSGSTSLKSLLNTKSKSRNKSVDREDKKEQDKDKKRGFFDNFRPRAKSDVSGLKRPAKKSPLPTERSMDESTLMAQTNLRPFVGSQEAITPMGQILEGQMLNLPEEERSRHKSGPSGYREGSFMSKIRTFSNSESKPPKSPKRPIQSQRSLSPPSSPRADRSGLSPLKFQSGEPRSAPPGLRGPGFNDQSHASYRQDIINRVFPESADRMEVEELSNENKDQTYSKFMKSHRCYDIIPTSAKLVVFDTNLNVKKAFFALIYNGVRAAPLWDTNRQDFVGMLTITDFISILKRLYKSPNVRMDELEDHKIMNWREMETERQRPFMYINPDASLFDAVRSLLDNHVHRLPVMDEVTGNALYILTHKRILRFLHMFMRQLSEPSFMRSSLRELGIGTYTNVITATPETTILTALNLFMDHRVSALPVVNSEGKIINIYAKFDVITLAADKSYNNLDITLEEALKSTQSSEGTEKVATCLPSETLSAVIDKIVRAEVHRLVIVDEEDHVRGILSLSDILRYIILRPVEVVAPCGAEQQAQREEQPPADEDPATTDEALLSDPELMGAEASESSQAPS